MAASQPADRKFPERTASSSAFGCVSFISVTDQSSLFIPANSGSPDRWPPIKTDAAFKCKRLGNPCFMLGKENRRFRFGLLLKLKNKLTDTLIHDQLFNLK